MRRRGPRPAGASIRALAESLAPRSTLGAVQRVWAEAVGEACAAHATPTGEGRGVLSVTCSSAAWAQEIDLMGPEILDRLEAALGARLVTALRCATTTPRGWSGAP
ncbi:MAG: DUF721 domain-containing protein [Solirubrobacteraceae bacterium]|nr:DUF721 domain-containing protein [Solirubrobacteraceae bacterium]